MGRDSLLVKLRDRLQQSGLKVLALVGQGGIGKTSLAAKLVEALGVDLGRGEVLASCGYAGVVCLRVAEGTGFEEVAERLLAAVGPEGLKLERVADKLAAIWRGLQQARWLVVLDNLEDGLHPVGHERAGRAIDPDLGRLLNGLVYEPHGSQVIVTSRERLRDLADSRSFSREPDPRLVVVETIEGISTTAGVALLRDLGLGDSEADLRWVVERVGGHVFVLRQLASLAARKPGYLRKNPQLVTREAGPILRAQLGRLDDVGRDLLKRMCVLRVGIDVRGLTFLRLFTDSEDEDFGRFSLAVALKEPVDLTDEEITETQVLVDQLISCSLVQTQYDEQSCENFYSLHRLVLEFLQSDFNAELPDLQRRAYAFYCTEKNIENPKIVEDLRSLLEAQHFAFQIGNYSEAKDLIYKLEDYLEPWGHWTMLQTLYLQILDRIPESSQPYILARLGSRERNWGNWSQAESYYQIGLTIAQKNQDKSIIAGLTGQLGDIENVRGNWDEAERLYRQCLQVEEELGDRSGMASSWGVMGDIERNRGNWDEAERLYRQSLQLSEELGDRSGMAATWASLGYIENVRGNCDEAERLYRQSLRLREELGDRSGMASAWGQLGDIENVRGNWDEAERLYRQCLQIEEELGNRSGMAAVWGVLGDIERNRGNWDEAEWLYRQCLQIMEKSGDRLGIGWITSNRGANELGRSNFDLAESLLQDALTQTKQLGMTNLLAEINSHFAKLYRAKNNPDLAEQHYQTAHQLYTQLGAAKDLEKIEQEWSETSP